MKSIPWYRRDPYDRILARLRNAPRLRQECAWCGAEIRPGVEPTSHGICAMCSKDYFNVILGRE